MPDSNWINLFLLDLQSKLFEVVEIFGVRIGNYQNVLKSKIVVHKKREHQVS